MSDDNDVINDGSKASRHDVQLGRRFFHMSMGAIVGTIYNVLATHQQAVYALGTVACLLYLFEQIRINYPEYAKKFSIVNHYFLRAEEQLQESAAMPYSIAILLTIITFPKSVAVASIYVLAFADPLSALVGIKYGHRKIVPHKTVEGSLAFCIAAFASIYFVFASIPEITFAQLWIVALFSSVCCALFEMAPIRLDDNLTIPLFTAFILSLISYTLGVNI